MPSPSPVPARSGALAAFLSFVFPGLGQGYLRQAGTALLFALPVLLLLGLLFAELADGLAAAALRLLDPAVAMIAVLVVIQLGAWRVLSVVHAWRTGSATSAGRLLVPVLVLAIVLTHGLGVLYAWSFVDAGQRIFDSDSASVLERPTTAAGEPSGELAPADPFGRTPAGEGNGEAVVSPGNTAVDGPLGRGASPTPEPTDSDLPPLGHPDEPELGVLPGPPPEIDPAKLDGADDGLLNVLLVGVDWAPGRTHALTDTLIVTSINRQSGEVYMFSFPRDIAEFPLYDGGTYLDRLNSFAGYAERHPERYPVGGLPALARQVGFLLGVPIDHYAAVNLPGFHKLINTVGGVTVHNERPINDPHLGFQLAKGEHRLDAEQVLKYVRSRKGPGNSDFERARRQQEVLAALRRELLRPERLVDLPEVLDAVAEVISTDLPPGQMEQLLELSELVSREPTQTWVFQNPDWAVHPPLAETNGRWILRLRTERLKELSREVFGEKSLYSGR